MPEALHQPAFIRKFLQKFAQVIAVPGIHAKCFHELAGPGTIEVQQVERCVHCNHKIRCGTGGRCQQLLRILAGAFALHFSSMVHQCSAEPVNPAPLLECLTIQGNPARVLPGGKNVKIEGKAFAGPHAAPEHGPDPCLSRLAVEQGLFRGDLAAGPKLKEPEHTLCPGHLVGSGVELPDSEAGTVLRRAQQP